MKDDFKDNNYSSHSIDIIQRRPNKKLEVILEENNSFNNDLNYQDMSESKTQANFYSKYSPLDSGSSEKKFNSSEKKKRNAKLHEKVKEIIEYRTNLNNLFSEEEYEEKELKKEEENNKRKKVEKKVNKNLQLLNLIKERMIKNEINEEKKEDIKKKNEEKKEIEEIDKSKNDENKSNNMRNKYTKREGIIPLNYLSNEKNNENNDNLNKENIEEEKKKKLLKIFENQRINKFKKREIITKKEKDKIEEEKYEENNNLKNNLKKNIPYTNSGAVSYSTFIKKGGGNFQINTPKLKFNNLKNNEDNKIEMENKEEQEQKNNYKKDEKFTEIPNSQRDRLTINIKPKIFNLLNDTNNSNKQSSFVNDSSNMKNINNIEIQADDKDVNDNNKNKALTISDKKENNIIKEEEENKFTKKEKKYKTYNNPSNKIENNNSSTKRGALKILELLKAKKKEENESLLRAKSTDRTINKNKKVNNIINKNEEDLEELPNIIDNQKIKDIDSSFNFNQRKPEEERQRTGRSKGEGKLDANSLPKKTFRDEKDDDENDYNYLDSHNKTQQYLKYNNKKLNNIKNSNDNLNRNINIKSNVNKKKNYINNKNKNMNLNKYLDLNDIQNDNQYKKKEEYINNANNLRNRYNKELKTFNSVSETVNNSPNNMLSKNENNKYSTIYTNSKLLDKSFDIGQSKKNPITKRILNNNKFNSINSNSSVYEPKKISTNNSPRRINNYERKKFNKNTNISMKNIRKSGNKARIYNKINNNMNKKNTTYIRKSPGRYKQINNYNSNYNDNLDYSKNERKNNMKNNYNKNLYSTNINNNANNNINNIAALEVSSIYGVNSSKDTYTTNTIDYFNNNYNDIYNNIKNNKINNNTIKYNTIDSNQKENSMLFNLEDLMVLEERLNDITIALETNANIEKKCFNFWNYYYNCSLYKILEKIFPNEEDSNIIRLSINYELMSIMICYEFSFQIQIINEDICLLLLELIYINHDNLMIICEYILTKISSENKDNIWVLKLQEMVNNLKMSQFKEVQNSYSLSPINKINNNTNKLIQKIKNILLNYTTELSHLLKNFLLKIDSETYEEINNFFILNILRVNNFEGSIMASSYLKENKYFNPIPAPYIIEPSNKPYTLVLDLDETLVNFKIKSSKEGTLRARPFLFGFLEEMGHFYELIVWTSATEAYANSLIDAIEFEKTYFDYVFYREHAIIIGDDFVKDLTRIGRSLDRIIIVDDMPQNFRLQRQNGITIKPFLGDDVNDMALYDLLPILKHIAEEGNDVRVGLAKYRDEIVKKITSNISKHNI